MSNPKVAVHGVGGRMGRAVVRALTLHPDLEVGLALDSNSSSVLGQDSGVLAGVEANAVPVQSNRDLSAVGAVIDFSLPEASVALFEDCAKHGVATIVGTTGLGEEQQAALKKLSATVPVVWAPNFSVGVNVLFHIAAKTAELLGDEFDAEVVEMHHRRKVDAPSGTAVGLAAAIREAKGLDRSAEVHGRSGITGPRPKAQIGVMTLRGGDVIGDHTAIFAGEGERLELIHRAQDRSLFANGAVRAAEWAIGRAPGLYSMKHVLGLAPLD